MTEIRGHPKEIREPMKAAVRLEKWNIFWTITYVLALGTAMGSSQAMKTAWVEDLLGFIPPIVFLVSERLERKGSNARYPYGYDRVNGLGFMIAAVALLAVGLFLLKDSVMGLVMQEHVTIGTVRLWGHDIWMGWFMLAAQAYATIPPLIIGRKELPLAEALRDKLIHTDALMNKANWQTGVAGFIGVAGIGFGLWWADSAAAIVISASIIRDGWCALKVSSAELADGFPRELGGEKPAKDALAIQKALREKFPKASIKMRETGRFIRAEVVGATAPRGFSIDKLDIDGLECRWRLDSVAFRP